MSHKIPAEYHGARSECSRFILSTNPMQESDNRKLVTNRGDKGKPAAELCVSLFKKKKEKKEQLSPVHFRVCAGQEGTAAQENTNKSLKSNGNEPRVRIFQTQWRNAKTLLPPWTIDHLLEDPLLQPSAWGKLLYLWTPGTVWRAPSGILSIHYHVCWRRRIQSISCAAASAMIKLMRKVTAPDNRRDNEEQPLCELRTMRLREKTMSDKLLLLCAGLLFGCMTTKTMLSRQMVLSDDVNMPI